MRSSYCKNSVLDHALDAKDELVCAKENIIYHLVTHIENEYSSVICLQNITPTQVQVILYFYYLQSKYTLQLK